MMQTYTSSQVRATPHYDRIRWMCVGGDGTAAGVIYAKVALIPQRSLNSVGGIREGRKFSRKKRMKSQQPRPINKYRT